MNRSQSTHSEGQERKFPIDFDSDDLIYEAVENTLRSILRLNELSPTNISSIGRALHFLDPHRLPDTLNGIDIEIDISQKAGSEREYEIQYWSIILKEEAIAFVSGSIVNMGLGSDSISGFEYYIELGGHREISGDMFTFINQLKFISETIGEYKIEVRDSSESN